MPKSIVNLATDVERHVLFDPAALSTGVSDYISVIGAHSFTVLVAMGATDNTLDLAINEATDASGTGAQALTVNGTAAAITQLSGTDDNKMAVLEVLVDGLSDGFTHVAASITVAGTTTGAVILEINRDKKPATQPAEIAETIVLVG